MKTRLLVGSGLALGCLLALGSCSNNGSDQPATGSSTMPFSDWSMGCESQQGGSQQQQQQVRFKQSQQQTCAKQSVQFPEEGISGFHFDVDCDSRRVNVTQQGAPSAGRALRTGSFPMQQDNTFKGQMSSQQKLPNDGKGSVSCWVEFVVNFDGKCTCERKDDGTWKKSVDVQSTVALQQADPSVFGGGHPSPVPSASPSPSPSVSPSLSPEPSVSPSPSPSVSPAPSPRPSVSPRPSPTPTIVPVVVCTVDNNACPWEGDGHMKCE